MALMEWCCKKGFIVRLQNNLRQMQSDGFESYHYNLKVGDPFHAGPYAMLVKNFAFSPEAASSHDYLKLPESSKICVTVTRKNLAPK